MLGETASTGITELGEALLAERSGIVSCRNRADEEATVFWIRRDEPVERQTARPV